MAKPWSQVQQSPAYQALPPMEKDKARKQYFEEVVIPKIGNDASKINAAWQLFDQDSAIPNYMDGERERVAATGSLSPAGQASLQADVDKYRAKAERGRNALEFLGGDNAPVLGPLRIVGTAFANSLEGTGRGIGQAIGEGLEFATRSRTGLPTQNPVNKWLSGRVDALRNEEAESRQNLSNMNAEIPGVESAKSVADIATLLPLGGAFGTGLKANMIGGAALMGSQPLAGDESRLARASAGAILPVALKPLEGVASVAARGLGDRITPAVSEMYRYVTKEGIQPTASNLIKDSPLKSTMEFIENLPFSGSAKRINDQLGSFTNTLGKKFGVNEREIAKSTLEEADKKLWNAREELVHNHDIIPDREFAVRLLDLPQQAKKVGGNKVSKLVANHVNDIFDSIQDGEMSGRLYTSLRGQLNNSIKRASDELKPHLRDLKEALDDVVVRSLSDANPKAATQLKSLNKATSDLMVTREALERSSQMPGVIDPKAVRATIGYEGQSGAPVRSTKEMRNLVDAAEKLKIGTARTSDKLQPLQGGGWKMAAKAALGLPLGATFGQFLNSRAGAKLLAEGVSNPALKRNLNTLAHLPMISGLAALAEMSKNKPQPNSGGGR